MVAHDACERLDEPDPAAPRHRHPAELRGDRDHPRHEPGEGSVRAEARMENPRGEQAVRLPGIESLDDPVPARCEHAAGELEQTPSAELPVRLRGQRQAGLRPQLGCEDAEREVGIRHELGDCPVPGRTVAGGEPLELLDVALVRGREEDTGAVLEQGAGRMLGIQILEPPRGQLLLELLVGRRAGEERVPGGEHFVEEPWQRELLGADRAPEHLVSLEDEHAPARSREQSGAGERVDPASDEHDVPAHRGEARWLIGKRGGATVSGQFPINHLAGYSRIGCRVVSVQATTVDHDLLAGARRAVSKWGWRGATLERIAREAGVSRVTLHRHGVSKSAILQGLAAAYEADYRQALDDAVQGSDPGDIRLERALNAMCDVSERHLATIVALADEASAVFFHEPGEETVSKRFITAPFRAVLEQGAKDGTLREADPDEWATVLTNLHWTYQHLRQSHGWSPARSKATLIRVVVDGVRA